MDVLNALFRWIHILAGIVWIGMLYFFNWVNGPFAATLDAETKKKVVPELMPRALFWFRWGAAWTWLTGLLLALMVFYHGRIMFEAEGRWSVGAIVMVALTFLTFPIYDLVHKSAMGKDAKMFGAIAFVYVVVFVLLMDKWAHFNYRALNIHLGAMFGSLMAANVWSRIWPAQQVIIRGIKGDGPAADPALVAFAGARSRQNVYMSVPLVWTMINYHTVTVPTAIGLPAAYAFVMPLLIVLLGWHIVWQLYRRAPKVKGF